jgi:hypothetical protein
LIEFEQKTKRDIQPDHFQFCLKRLNAAGLQPQVFNGSLGKHAAWERVNNLEWTAPATN